MHARFVQISTSPVGFTARYLPLPITRLLPPGLVRSRVVREKCSGHAVPPPSALPRQPTAAQLRHHRPTLPRHSRRRCGLQPRRGGPRERFSVRTSHNAPLAAPRLAAARQRLACARTERGACPEGPRGAGLRLVARGGCANRRRIPRVAAPRARVLGLRIQRALRQRRAIRCRAVCTHAALLCGATQRLTRHPPQSKCAPRACGGLRFPSA